MKSGSQKKKQNKKYCPISKIHCRNFCSKHMRLLFEKISREAPLPGLLGISSNNGFYLINAPIRDLGWALM